MEAVKTRFDTYSSFHITSVCEDPSVFMKDDLWPERAFVRWWREAKKVDLSQGGFASIPTERKEESDCSIAEADVAPNNAEKQPETDISI